MRADVLARLGAIARGETLPPFGGTRGTGGTLSSVPPQKPSSFHAFHLFHLENNQKGTAQIGGGTAGGTPFLADGLEVTERAAIAIELGRVPPAYAYQWAIYQTRKPRHIPETDWFRAVNDAGRFLDEWAALALEFGWQPTDIFGPNGLASFCVGEGVRALGPDNAITMSGRIFTRSRQQDSAPTCEGTRQASLRDSSPYSEGGLWGD
jgi:hypothetical protein